MAEDMMNFAYYIDSTCKKCIITLINLCPRDYNSNVKYGNHKTILVKTTKSLEIYNTSRN